MVRLFVVIRRVVRWPALAFAALPLAMTLLLGAELMAAFVVSRAGQPLFGRRILEP